MTWKDKMSEWGGGDLSFLTEDGETITFVVIGEPVLIEGKYKGKDTQRIGAPVMTRDGFTLLIIGKRIARRLSKHEHQFKKVAFDIIRHGDSDDTKTTYELLECDDAATVKALFELAKTPVPEADILDAIEAAEQAAQG